MVTFMEISFNMTSEFAGAYPGGARLYGGSSTALQAAGDNQC